MRFSMTDHSDPVSRADVDFRFGPASAQPLDDEQVARCRALREGGRLFARHVLASCPCSWERDEAIKAIDNATSFAVRSISRHE